MIAPELLALIPTLDVLLAERNVTRAAARLGISQSRMSARLAQLRALLGDPLLTPAIHGRGMIPTPRALALQAELAAPLATIETALAPLRSFDPLASTRTFRILTNDNAAAIAGSAFINAVQEGGGTGMAFAFLNLDVDRFPDQLERIEADIVLASEALLSKQESLVSRRLLRDGFATARRRNHPSRARALDMDAFCSLDHIMVSSEGGGFSGPVDEALAAAGRSRRVVVSVQSYLLAVMLVASTDLVATLPSRLLRIFEDGLDVLQTPFELRTFNLGIAWHPRMQADPGHIWLRQRFVALANQGAT